MRPSLHLLYFIKTQTQTTSAEKCDDDCFNSQLKMDKKIRWATYSVSLRASPAHCASLSRTHTHTHPSASAEAVMAPKAFTHPSVTHLCICIYISYLVQEQVMSEPHGSLKERTRLSVRAASDVTWRHDGRERACVECWMRNDYGQGMLHRKI